MIRLIARQTGTCPDGAYLGATYRTFDIEHQELEQYLNSGNGYALTTLVGAEVLTTGDGHE